ncbi:MAG: PEGA domain-containing protein, partial [Spirochaetales bacterium]|nr:PEGA domain-containing protein [Spirochaetales bacterium]
MSEKITDEDIEKAIVKLKPVFGIKPGIYLTVIYGLILLLALFFILVYPGVKNNGTMVYAETFPAGAAVYVDDIYRGSTPASFFVASGERKIKIEKKYFETITTEDFIDGRVFGTLFFPKKLKISSKLSLINQKEFLKDRFTQLSAYALIEDYYDRYQMPPLISETVGEYLSGSGNKQLLYGFLYSMRVNLGSPEMVLDYVKSIDLAGNSDSKKDNSQNDFSIIFDYFADENNMEGLLLGIVKAYPLYKYKREDIIESLGEIEGVKSILNNLNVEYSDIETAAIPAVNGKTVVINNSKFLGFSSGTYLTGHSLQKNNQILSNNDILTSFPHEETVTEFYILEKEVTRKDYALFLDENPGWKVENINNLIEDNLVTKDYLNLQDFNDKGKPVSNISWYAAAAYC